MSKTLGTRGLILAACGAAFMVGGCCAALAWKYIYTLLVALTFGSATVGTGLGAFFVAGQFEDRDEETTA